LLYFYPYIKNIKEKIKLYLNLKLYVKFNILKEKEMNFCKLKPYSISSMDQNILKDIAKIKASKIVRLLS